MKKTFLALALPGIFFTAPGCTQMQQAQDAKYDKVEQALQFNNYKCGPLPAISNQSRGRSELYLYYQNCLNHYNSDLSGVINSRPNDTRLGVIVANLRETAKTQAQQREAQDFQQFNARFEDNEKQQADAQAAAFAHQVAAIKAGKGKPQSVQEAAAVYGARNGQGLIENPALRPDGKMYAMIGVIDPRSDVERGVLIIRGVQMNMLAGSEYGNTVGYAVIKFKNVNAIPANAHIGDQLEIVGHYTANRSYTTLVGQQKAMPVLDAEWSKSGPSIF